MSSVLVDLGLVSLLGGLFGLDRRAAFQFMAAQPLVALSVMGWLFGDVYTGVWLGALLQLLWMTSVLFGASTPPNEQVAATSIGGMVLTYGHWIEGPAPAEIWALAILIGAPLSLVGRWMDQRIDRANISLAERADAAARAGHLGALSRVPLVGLLRVFAANALLVGVGGAVGFALLALCGPALGSPVSDALAAFAFYFVPGLGLAVALADLPRRSSLLVAITAFAFMLLALDQGPL